MKVLKRYPIPVPAWYYARGKKKTLQKYIILRSGWYVQMSIQYQDWFKVTPNIVKVFDFVKELQLIL
jgi:hypothetical protein